ncbi:putative efflux pump membrane fusion protein [Candidatus Rubidus massiliensis]|nr:putative efflux pump membrane fusion protein [Candidatus Rubidus massiliensis]
MSRNYFKVIAFLTVVSLFLIIWFMWREAHKTEPKAQVSHHPVAPFKSYIAGVGIVEASSENIIIGTPLQRVVKKVFVKVGEEIQAGSPLIELENRDLEAELKSKEVDYQIAVANYEKLKDYPRFEDIASAEANLKSAQASLFQAKHEYDIVEKLEDKRALSQNEINRRKVNFEQAQAKVDEAKSAFSKTQTGTWKPDLEIAKLQILQAKTNVDRIKTEIERTIIRSPIAGKVLQAKIHEGELAMDASVSPMMVIGNTTEKYLDVSINQFNAPYFNQNAPAVAYLQGDPNFEFPLEFVHLEPYLVRKKNLTNDISEKTDTRVLQVTYRFLNGSEHLYVGQQMDVFIESNQMNNGAKNDVQKN